MSIKKGNISIHTENIFPIIKKWLYSDKDIFIRELISNGCDAVSKYKRLVSLGEAEGNLEDEKFKVVVSVNKEEGTLTFSDNGIGMTYEEVEKYITQVAFSGAEDFVEKYKDKMGEGNDIIGHFGLGFYSAFMVAKKVEINTLSYKKDEKAVQWLCEGGTDYEIGESDIRKERGTTITLFIDEESNEFLDFYKVSSIVDKYCSFLPTEIFVVNENEEKKEELTAVNNTTPLWTKKPSECSDEEYKEFYKKVFNDFEEPLFWIHLNVDYPFNLKGILYFPKLKNEFELVEGKVKLFNNQVFVADNIKEVIPEFLLLLKGVIDCPDLPLNVSRSFLQNDRDVSRISKHIVKKVADKLKSIFNNERDTYNKFWDDIHLFIKFGCLKDEDFYEKIKDIIVFKNLEGIHTTLKDYLEKAKENHENKVYYVSNDNEQAQYIKLFKENNLDAIYLNSPIDNNFISFLEYKDGNVKFNRIDSDLSDILKDKEAPCNPEENEKLISLFKGVIGDKINDYKVEFLKDEETSSMVLLSEHSRRMAEMQAQFGNMGINLPEEKTLILNLKNPLVKKVVDLIDKEEHKDVLNILCMQIVDLALISNKSLDAKGIEEFVKRTNQLMIKML